MKISSTEANGFGSTSSLSSAPKLPVSTRKENNQELVWPWLQKSKIFLKNHNFYMLNKY